MKRLAALALFFTLILSFIYLFQTTAYSNTETTLHANQLNQDLTHDYLQAINRSQKSVLLLIFSLKDKKIIEALNKKSREGIPVQIITDAKGSSQLPKMLDPQIQLTRRFFKGLMHLKIMVIDSDQVWIGSANMTTDSFKRHGNLVLSVNLPSLARMVEQKAALLGEHERHGFVPSQTFHADGQQITMNFFPDDPHGAQQVKQLIRSAQKTIKVAMYTWTRMDFAYELMVAKQRGVDVQIALDKSSSNGVSKKVSGFLKNKDISIKHNSGKGLLHHKFLYIDGKILALGSANWTKAAFKTNDDCLVVLQPLTEQQVAVMDQLWEVVAAD